MEFFMPMIPPTVTAQEKKVTVRNGHAIFYEPAELKAAKSKLLGELARHKPDEPITGQPVELVVKWCFPEKTKTTKTTNETKVTWRIEKPDTDNLNKLLKDCMTKVGFWKDDALVCRDIIEKFWVNEHPGIYIRVEELNEP